eukprot:g69079.t1
MESKPYLKHRRALVMRYFSRWAANKPFSFSRASMSSFLVFPNENSPSLSKHIRQQFRLFYFLDLKFIQNPRLSTSQTIIIFGVWDIVERILSIK